MSSLETETTTIRAIWKDVLGVDVGPEADFFELGGDSIGAFDVIMRVAESLQVELTLQAVYTHTTVPQLAAEIVRLRASTSASP